MRLAFGLGRTVAELDESLSYAEWLDWIAFHALYDLPDGFLVAGQLGKLVANVAGNPSAKAQDFAPFYVPPPPRAHVRPTPPPGLFALLRTDPVVAQRERKPS